MIRIYNGCPDDELAAEVAHEKKLMAVIRKIRPDAHCTYFPIEETWEVHEWGKPITTGHTTCLSALEEALKKI